MPIKEYVGFYYNYLKNNTNDDFFFYLLIMYSVKNLNSNLCVKEVEPLSDRRFIG